MSLLVDLFGYLTIVVHGLAIVAQSMASGGVLFLLVLARPYIGVLPCGAAVVQKTARVAGWAALGLFACEAANLFMDAAVLVSTVGISVFDALSAPSAVAGLVKATLSLLLAVLLLGRRRAPAFVLAPAAVGILVAAVFTTHAAARLEDSTLLMCVEFLHIAGAAIWIGGIPFFVLALARLTDGAALRRVGPGFSRVSMAGVACILLSGVTMTLFYIGSWDAVYGTAYGVMVMAKVAMFGFLLLLGLGNLLVTERMRRDPETSTLRLRRFAEVEIGIGFSIFFAAASLTSVPPAVDLRQDRVTWAEVIERNTPVWPRFQSPDHDALTLPALQAQLDREAADATQGAKPQPAFVPGSGEIPDRNAADIAWSEYNHHWAGLFVILIAVLALLNRAGVGWARHWPLAFLLLAVFLFLRSDPEVWPLGEQDFMASFRDVEVLQHRVFVVLIVVFAFFEWGVRTGRIRRPGGALVFPLATALGGALLLTHSHAIANIKDQLLIELTHTPLALAGIAAGWARWLEIRLKGRGALVAGYAWPACFLIVGVVLLWYREA